MSYQALARKWRPRRFADMVGQEHVVQALVNALDHDRLHHAFLFTGTRGVGKTTVARILAKSLNCEQGVSSNPCGTCAACVAVDEGRFVDLIEVDAASRTKVDDTRELLDNVQYAPTRGRYKVYLIDEVHMLSGHSFNALLKTLEEPPPHVKFLLATTDPQKLPVTVLSRCLQFNLKPLTAEQIAAQLTRILEAEQLSFEAPAVKLLARAADGSLRDGLSLLDQAIAHGAGSVTEEQVRGMLGTIEQTHLRGILTGLCEVDPDAIFQAVTTLSERTPDYAGALDELLLTLYHIALQQAAPAVLAAKAGDTTLAEEFATRLSPEDVQLFYQIGVLGKRDLPLAPDPRSGFEMVLLRMLAFRPAQATQAAPVSGPAEVPRPSTPVQSRPAGTEANARTKVAPTATPAPAPEPRPAPAPQQQTGDVFDPARWTDIAQSLDISGLVRELASHAVPDSVSNERVVLMLAKGYARLSNEDRRRSLEEALQKFTGRTLRLQIKVGEPTTETPAEARRRLAGERQQAAEESIHSDPNVQALVEHFDARVGPDTIRPKSD
jgi:DNA polymerase-3 subunit gamma/tau